MSAPQTNINKQKRRHRGPLVGMAVVLTFVGLLLFWWLGEEASQNNVNPGAQALPEGTQVGPDGAETDAPAAQVPAGQVPAGQMPAGQAPANN
jgi:hypothetical protein